MSPVIEHVVAALNNIDADFYQIEDVAFNENGLIDLGKVRNLERRFMHAFSIEYAKLMNRDNPLYEWAKYDFEVPKKFMWYDNPDLLIRKTWEHINKKYGDSVNMLKYFEAQPDFLVHADQNDMTFSNQTLIIEAKTNPSTSKGETFKDIFHTFIYANKYNFQHNVLMLVNLDLQRWHVWLKEYCRNNLYLGKRNRYENIYVIHKAHFGAPVEVKTISELLNT
ncbi:hypothetical protein [Aquipseudomonas alcaligenes]|uniref:hypothetical protein n=1 Tax=Aquipseudomonas alcaligenes TaxID=43263 RepID=UPI00077FEA03|nr:hypothetical protein [Pseudomonas alcaligenes]AMR65057.1 hypothetical protein A0T30_01255 [Pseudomonas alcaligenes]